MPRKMQLIEWRKSNASSEGNETAPSMDHTYGNKTGIVNSHRLINYIRKCFIKLHVMFLFKNVF